MNTQTLKDLINAAQADIIAKTKAEVVMTFKVAFHNKEGRQAYDYLHTRKLVKTNVGMRADDPRILLAAISLLKPAEMTRLRLTADELRMIPFENNPRYNNYDTDTDEHMYYVGDRRFISMDKDEVEIQNALGIKDNSVSIQVHRKFR